MQKGTEGEVLAFPTPEGLWKLTFAEENAWRDRFSAIPFEDRGGYRNILAIKRTTPSARSRKMHSHGSNWPPSQEWHRSRRP